MVTDFVCRVAVCVYKANSLATIRKAPIETANDLGRVMESVWVSLIVDIDSFPAERRHLGGDPWALDRLDLTVGRLMSKKAGFAGLFHDKNRIA